MPNKRERDYEFNEPTKTVRFDDGERERLRAVMRLVRARNGFTDPSKLIKELMGLTNVIGLTEEERRIISGSPVEGKVELLARAGGIAEPAPAKGEVRDRRTATKEEVNEGHEGGGKIRPRGARKGRR